MKIKSYISRLIMKPLLLKILILFRPRHFLIHLYSSLLFYDLPKDLVADGVGGVIDVVAGYGKNLKMILSLGDKANPQNIYYWLGLYELEIQRLFAKLIKPGFVIYDIGAYLGFFSLLAARLAGPSGRVYAFEPLADNIERIKSHLSLNGMADTVFCIPKAVFEKTDNVPFYNVGRDDWGRIGETISATEKYPSEPSAIAETISLDEFIFQEGNPAPHLIKIDVEGREGKVLAGARQLLKKFKPIIICEVHYPEAAKQVYEELSGLGYEFKDIREKKLNNVSSYCGHIIAWPNSRGKGGKGADGIMPEMNNSYIWDKLWAKTKGDEDFLWWAKHENEGVRGRKIISYIDKHLGSIKGLKAIEVGSGAGIYSFVFARRGAAVTLLDYSEKALALAREHFAAAGLSASFICADALSLNLNLLGKFDLAMSFGTVEHFLYPERLMMANAHLNLVRPGGVVIISGPNRLFFPHEILKFFLQRKGKWHLGYERAFVRNELFRLGKSLGLEKIEVQGSAFVSDIYRYFVIFQRTETFKKIFRFRIKYGLTRDFSSPWDNLFGADLFLMGHKSNAI